MRDAIWGAAGRMSLPILFGASYSVYVRAVRLVLTEKSVPYRLSEVDVFAPGGPPKEYLARQPFGRIPAFEHDGLRLYESDAICRYIDEAFAGPALQPATARQRARMTQVVSILDSYAYRPMVWDIFVERVRSVAQGRNPDEARIAAAVPRAALCLSALEDILGENAWLAGESVTLADLHAAPMFAYFVVAEEGRRLLHACAALHRWWDRMNARPSMAATRAELR